MPRCLWCICLPAYHSWHLGCLLAAGTMMHLRARPGMCHMTALFAGLLRLLTCRLLSPLASAALDGGSGQLTALGRAMAAYPISPRHARMLMEVALQEQQAQQAGAAEAAGAAGTLAAGAAAAAAAATAAAGGSSSRLRRVLPYAVALAAVLSVDSPFVHVDSISAGGEGGEGGAKAAPDAAAAAAAEEVKEGEEDGEDGQVGSAKAEKAAEKEAAKRKRQAARQAHAQFRVADSDALRCVGLLVWFSGRCAGPAVKRQARQNTAGTASGQVPLRHGTPARPAKHASLCHCPPSEHTSPNPCHLLCSALRALCAFEAAGEDEAFCRRNFLHFRNLREAAALHKQLARQLEAQGARQRSGPTSSSTSAAAAAPALALGAGGAGGPLPPPAPAVMEQLRRALAAGWADQVARRIRSIDYLRAQEQQVGGCLGWMACREMESCVLFVEAERVGPCWTLACSCMPV